MKVKALRSYHDEEKGRVKIGDTWETKDSRAKELINLELVEREETANEDEPIKDEFKGLLKPDLQKIYKEEIGEDPDDSKTVADLKKEIIANRNS